MSAEKFKVVARLGQSTKIPLLINGELGYDIDTKTARMGDDTLLAPKIATSKSTGKIEYLEQLTTKQGTIELYEGSKVDGVDPSTMNQENGAVVRVSNGVFINRQIVGDPDYIQVTNPDGKDGDFTISLSESIKNAIGNISSAIKFTWGFEFPENVQPGHIHYDENEEIIFIFVRQSDQVDFWMDIGSPSGGGGGGNRLYIREDRPPNAIIGDEWYDPSTSRFYVLLSENQNVFWVEK